MPTHTRPHSTGCSAVTANTVDIELGHDDEDTTSVPQVMERSLMPSGHAVEGGRGLGQRTRALPLHLLGYLAYVAGIRPQPRRPPASITHI
jgi:hypothetical protein